jgi:hypothetical protein
MARKWYHVETGNPKTKDTIAKYLRRNRITYEVKDAGLNYDWWRVRVLIYDQRMLDDVNRFLATI